MNDLMEGFCDEHLVCQKNAADNKEEIKEMKKEIDALWRTSDNTKERVMKLEFTIEQLNKTVESVSSDVKDIKFESRKNKEDNDKQMGKDKEEILGKIEGIKETGASRVWNVLSKILEVVVIVGFAVLASLQYFGK